MTCLTVSNNIHATSAPTGTDDDTGGNDKADASQEQIWITREPRRSAQLLSKPGRPVWTFYDISGRGMHLWGTRKTPGVAGRRHRLRNGRKANSAGQLAIFYAGDIVPGSS
jgi:hypothetical protein